MQFLRLGQDLLAYLPASSRLRS